MDEQLHERPDDHDLAGADDASAELDEPARLDDEVDLLDEAVVPLLGLSGATIAAVFVGGALGTVARYVLAAHHPVGPGSFPWLTLLVNLSGSFAIGLLVPVTEHASRRAPVLRPFLMIGVLGGWTTYSTLAVDATLLLKDEAAGLCLAYLAATVIGGLSLVVAGHDLGRRLVAR